MTDLRPMEFGEILDGTFTLFRRHFRLFLQLSLIVMTAPVALGIYFRLRFLSGTADHMTALIQADPLNFGLQALLAGLVYGVGTLLLTAGSVRVISDSYLGRAPELSDALGLGMSKFVPLFLVGLGKGLALVVLGVGIALAVVLLALLGKVAGGVVAVLLAVSGVLGGIVLWLWVGAGFMVTTPVVVLETLDSSFDAFGRSWDLTRAGRWRVLGVVTVGWIITNLIPALILQAIGAILFGATAGVNPAFIVLSALVPVALAPILPCIVTLLYYDLRVRREAFDLQLLSQQLDQL